MECCIKVRDETACEVIYILIPLSFDKLLLDNDDDGESAAGGRLAHLLQILVRVVLFDAVKQYSIRVLKDVENVLVVVTRYFGGIHLGPDRFKHINQAARNALEIGGFLDAPGDKKNSSRLARKR